MRRTEIGPGFEEFYETGLQFGFLSTIIILLGGLGCIGWQINVFGIHVGF